MLKWRRKYGFFYFSSRHVQWNFKSLTDVLCSTLMWPNFYW